MKPELKEQSGEQRPDNDEYGVVPEPATVRLERMLPGPIERVWAYLTESDKRGKWFAAGPMELRAGGKLKFHFHNSKLSRHPEPIPERFQQYEGMKSTGEVTRCEPPHLLSFSWDEEHGWESEVTFELADRDGKVHLVLTHRRLRNRSEMIGVASGWHAHVAILIDLLEDREPGPFWSVIDKLEGEYAERIPDEAGSKV